MKKHNKNESKFKGIEKSVIIVGGLLTMIGVIFQISPTIQQLRSKIAIIDVQTEDLSCVGIYMTSEEACVVTTDDTSIYKKGAVLHVLIENPKDDNETIKECTLVVTDIKKLEESNVVYFPVTFDDSIGIYAANNAETDSNGYDMDLKLTFGNTYGDTDSEIEYATEDTVHIDLMTGEAREIYSYDFKELDEIFLKQQQNMEWAHIVADIEGELVSIGHISNYGGNYESFINQGGQGSVPLIPIYLEYNHPDNVQVKNNFPEISSNSTGAIDFMLLPDESVEVRFYFDITFTNGDKTKSAPETVEISVPIYEDRADYSNLREYIKKSKSKRLVYNKDDFMDSDFIYDPEKLYGEYLEEYWK